MNAPRRLYLTLLIPVVLGASIGVFYLLKMTKPTPEKLEKKVVGPLVAAIRAKAVDVPVSIIGYGTARPKREVRCSARVGGEIVEMSPRLRDGAFFSKGTVLLRIDPRPYRLAIQNLEAQIRQADAALKQIDREKVNIETSLGLVQSEIALAERDLDRTEKLAKAQANAESRRDFSEAALLIVRGREQSHKNQLALIPSRRETAEAQRSQLETQLERARLDLEYTEILAPFDGRVLERQVEVGDSVAPGSPLARIYDAATMEILVRLSQEEFQWLDLAAFHAPGAPVSPVAPPEATARLQGKNGGYQWKGRVARVDGKIDPATRTPGVIVETDPMKFEETWGQVLPLVPGQFVEVEIEGRTMQNVFPVPRGAVDEGGVVYLAVDGRLEKRSVTVVRTARGTAYISDGLNDVDSVIVAPLAAPVEGMLVRAHFEGENADAPLPEISGGTVIPTEDASR